jgi:hypothetical protein
MQEFLRIALRVTPYLTDKECEELAHIVNVIQQTTLLSDDEVDDLSASLAFAKLSLPPSDTVPPRDPSP